MIIEQKIKHKFHLIEIKFSLIEHKIPISGIQIRNPDSPSHSNPKKPADILFQILKQN